MRVVEVDNGKEEGYVLLRLLEVTRRHVDRYPISSCGVALIYTAGSLEEHSAGQSPAAYK